MEKSSPNKKKLIMMKVMYKNIYGTPSLDTES